jgi:hypothetical protein
MKGVLVIGIIFLFLGVAVQPAFAVDVSITKASESKDDCEICPKVSNQHIVLIKSLLNRLERSKEFNFDTSYLGSLDICDILYKIVSVLSIPLLFFASLSVLLADNSVILNILQSIFMLYTFGIFAFPFILYFNVFDCHELYW